MEDGRRTTLTERLVLAAVSEADLADLHALSADARVWTHFPSGRHTDLATSQAQVESFAAAWVHDGLGYWTARLRSTGEFVGVGGCMAKGDLAWNLYYRFRPEAQGLGYAGELTQAAIHAAHEIDDRPVVAYLLEHNVASRRTAERAGLSLVSRGPDYGNPDPTAIRLIYADTAVDAATIAALAT